MWRLLTLCGAVWLVACSSPHVPTDGPPPTPPTAVAIASARGSGYGVMVHKLADPYPEAGAPAPVTPSPDHRYVGVDLTVQNEGASALPYAPRFLQVQDTQGTAYRATQALGSEQLLSERSLSPGNRVRGWVAFELPVGALPRQVQFQPDGAPPLTLALP